MTSIRDCKIFKDLIEVINTFEKINDDLYQYNNKITEFIISKYLLSKFQHKKICEIKNYPVKSENEFIIYKNCVITNSRIENPARTNKCKHIECVELSNLVDFILINGYCPVCSMLNSINKDDKFTTIDKIGLDSIYIDKFMKDLYKNEFSKENPFVILNKTTLKSYPFDFSSKFMLLNRRDEDDIGGNEFLAEYIDINNYIGTENNKIEIEMLASIFKNIK